MRHIKKYEEIGLILDYYEVYELGEFNENHKKERFSYIEKNEIKILFNDVELNDYENDNLEIGELYLFSYGKSININKFNDEWYTVIYINPSFTYEKYWICDQFKGLIDCLSMIKNKDIDFR